MNRAVRRPLIALVIATVVVGAWVLSPRVWAPAGPLAETAPSQAVHSEEAATASAAPSAPAATASADPAATASADPAATASAAPQPSANPSSSPHPGIRSATPMLRTALDARLERLRAKYGIPGISAAVLFADGSIWRGSAGLADVEAGRPVTSDTAFSVASISKTFTAALILTLAEDGRLSLDSTARTYLPGLPIDRAITVRQLLDHTSGLRDFYYHPRIDKALLSKPAVVWDAARSLSYVGKPHAQPGVSWHYSNTNYLVLGMLAEAVGRAPVADQLRDRFFTPLGLIHTYYQAVAQPRGPVARGYRFTGSNPTLPAIDLSDGSQVVPFTSVVTASGAAGSIATNADDLAHWAQALYGGNAIDRASRDTMVADIVWTARYRPAVSYGLGVQVIRVDGHLTLGHSGRFLGSSAAVRWLPDERIAIAVLTNQSRTDPNVVLAALLKSGLQPQPDCLGCPAIP